MFDPLLAISLEAFTQPGFWIGVGVIAGIYTLLALGLQLNVGFTGIVNFGQAAFMAIGRLHDGDPGHQGRVQLLARAPGIGADHDRVRDDRRASGPEAARRLLRDRHDRAGGSGAPDRPERARPDWRQPGPLVLRRRRGPLLLQRVARRLGLDQRVHRGHGLERPRAAPPAAAGHLGRRPDRDRRPHVRDEHPVGPRAPRRPRGRGRRAGARARTRSATSSSRWRSRPPWARSAASSSPSTSPRSTRSTSSRRSRSSPSAS